MAVNTIDKLQFLSFIFAVSLSVTVHFIALGLGRKLCISTLKFCWNSPNDFRDVMFFYFIDGNWPPCWIFKRIKFYMQMRLGGSTHITMPNFLETDLSKADTLQFLGQFHGAIVVPSVMRCRCRCRRCCHGHRCAGSQAARDSTASDIWWMGIRRLAVANGPNFFQMLLVWIFKMAAATILDFWNRKILLAIGVERIETHQRAKFRQNLSIGCQDFDFSRWRLPPSWIV